MKSVFSYNSDTRKTAYLNWRTKFHEPIYNMQVIAKGYIQASIELAECCLADNSDMKADILVFPMLFSFNQGIEIYEKSIYWSMNILLGYKKLYPISHDIRQIWYADKEKITKYGFDENAGRSQQAFNSMIIELERYLNELYNKIKKNKSLDKASYNIDFSRYPLNSRFEKHFYIEEFENVVIDLENFILVAKDIYECLESLAGYYYSLVLEKC